MDFDAAADTWDEPHRVERAARIAEAIRRTLDLTDRPRTLELGSGTGLLSRALADRLGPVTLTDNAARMVEVGLEKAAAAGHSGWDGAVVNLGVDPLPAGPYDLVVSQLALHHLDDVATLLKEVVHTLSPGGQVALVDLDSDPAGLFHSDHPDFDGHHGFNREQLADWLTAAECTNVRMSTPIELTKEVDGVEHTFPLFLATGVKA